MIGDSEEETLFLRAMAVEAREYLTGQEWCPAIETVYLTFGVGGVVAVFLIELEKKINDRDQYLWVVVGDLPSAYMVTDDLQTPRDAMEAYCEIMNDWVRAVLSGSGLADVYPAEAEATQDNALAVASRLVFLKDQIIPRMSD